MTTDISKAEELRIRYMTEAIETATPAGRLTMLFDSLEMDLIRAEKAFAENGGIKTISDLLIHAQDILILLRDTIDVSAWEPGARLQALYDHLYRELVQANLDKDPARVAETRSHVSRLAEAWREAARSAESPSTAVPAGR